MIGNYQYFDVGEKIGKLKFRKMDPVNEARFKLNIVVFVSSTLMKQITIGYWRRMKFNLQKQTVM